MLRRFLKPDPQRETARRLYDSAIKRARAPIFYTRLAVPDSIDGRFDVLTLHVFLVMEALKGEGAAGEVLSAHLATVTFEGFEEALRDLGVGDIGLSKRMKAMANAFYGRLEAYRAAERSPGVLALAVRRNLYRTDEARLAEAEIVAGYALDALRHLEESAGNPTLLQGGAEFGPLPEP
jgi:cytochrome b pre-mRNA-processing protein 3